MKNKIFAFVLLMGLIAMTFTSSCAAPSNKYDTQQVKLAQAALINAGTLNPIEGVDTNITTMAQSIVNKTVSGVIVKYVSTTNTQIINQVINYGTKQVSGTVTFDLVKNKAKITQTINVIVPATKIIQPIKPDPPNVSNDDILNTVSGMDINMEYNLDNSGYVSYNSIIFNTIDFSGDHILLVRIKAEGINPPSDAVTLTFTTNPPIIIDAYYVSTTGNDNNLGTFDQPFKTIQKAANIATAGQTIYIRGGTYNERVWVKNSGSLNNYITFINYNNEIVIIDGSGGLVSTGASLFDVSYRSYIKIIGLQVQNSDWVGIGSPYLGCNNIIVQNCTTYKTQSSGINLVNGINAIIDNNLVNYANLLPASQGGSDEAITICRMSNFEVSNNIVRNPGKEAIDIKDGSSNGSVYNNIIESGTVSGIYLDAFSKLQENIEVYNNSINNVPYGIFLAGEIDGTLNNINIHDNEINNCNIGFGTGAFFSGYNHYMDNIIFNNNNVIGSKLFSIGFYNPQATNVKVTNNILNGTSTSIPIWLDSVVSISDYYIDGNALNKVVTGYPTGTNYTIIGVSNIVYLPSALLIDNPTNVSQQLEDFLNTCSGKTVIFPQNKTFILEKQLAIHNVSNITIDFNNSTLKLKDGYNCASRSDTGDYVASNTGIVIHDSTNVKISNYIIDGNSQNISTTNWCIGMYLLDIDGFISNNGYFKNCNYHQLVIGENNICDYVKNIKFYNTTFKDHGGASGGAGISDVYINNRITDDFSFIGVIVDNTELKEYSLQAQCFYIAGFNGYFENVNTNNCANPLDIRYGTHIAKDFTINNAYLMLMIQPYPSGNGTAGYANLTASNFTGTNIKGISTGGGAGIFIIGCEKVSLDNFNITMDTNSTVALYGIRIQKYYTSYPIDNIIITNSTIKGFRYCGVMMSTLQSSTNINTLTTIGGLSSSYGVMTASCTVPQYVTNLIYSNCIKSSSSDGMLVLN